MVFCQSVTVVLVVSTFTGAIVFHISANIGNKYIHFYQGKYEGDTPPLISVIEFVLTFALAGSGDAKTVYIFHTPAHAPVSHLVKL